MKSRSLISTVTFLLLSTSLTQAQRSNMCTVTADQKFSLRFDVKPSLVAHDAVMDVTFGQAGVTGTPGEKLFSFSRSGYTPTLLVAYGGLSGEHWFYQHADVFDDAKLLRFTPRRYLDARAIRRPVMAPDWDWHHQAVAAGAKRIVDAGGHVQIGAHGQRQGLGAHWEMWALAQGGMSPAQVLKCATWSGAWYLGMDHEIGSIDLLICAAMSISRSASLMLLVTRWIYLRVAIRY